MLATVLEGRVDRSEVFAAAHGRDPLMGGFVYRGVVECEANWIPSLLDFRVDVVCAIVIHIDLFEDGSVHFVNVGLEGIMEDDLEIRVVAIVCSVIRWGSSTVESNIAESELCSLV